MHLRPSFLMLLFLLALFPKAAAGVGELTLDRGAVAELLDASTPRRLEVELPRIGTTTLLLGPPRDVAFVDGGVELRLDVGLERPALKTELVLRYVPRVEPRYGAVRLEPEIARLDALGADVAQFLPAASLPRSFDASFALDGERRLELIWHVQGVRVGADRLRVELGLVARAPR